MHSNELEALRAVVADETRPIAERRDAAAHLIRLQVAAIPTASEDDPEVAELMQPWPRRTETETWIADEWAKITQGRSVTGWSKADATAKVTERHRQRVLLAAVVNVGLSQLERLAACQMLIDESHPEGVWRKNAIGPERLLAEVKTDDAIKYTSSGPKPLCRPPLELADVW